MKGLSWSLAADIADDISSPEVIDCENCTCCCKNVLGRIFSQIDKILSTKLSLTVNANPLTSSVNDGEDGA